MTAKRKPEVPLLVACLLDALDDFERCLDGLSAADAERSLDEGGSIGWTTLHIAQHLDSWVNESMGGLSRNREIAVPELGVEVPGTRCLGARRKAPGPRSRLMPDRYWPALRPRRSTFLQCTPGVSKASAEER